MMTYFLVWCLLAHITITAMSLSFHRMHTHKGVVLNDTLDRFFQIWLWLTTSMNKKDWVSVHIYHHAHSDKEKDPHSPVLKGFFRVFFLGALDYTRAAKDPEVMRIQKNIPENKMEAFIRKYHLLGPVITGIFLLLILPVIPALCLTLSIFLISPLLAVGGVNTIAHTFGYRNYKSSDNSRNIGFLFPLNFIICGELDHNNHHAHPKSCSFRHKWYEFDIGYFYISLFKIFGLAKVNFLPPKNKKLNSEKALSAA